jgi:hypothetical protein
MSTEKKRTLIAAVRRVAFAGIILFATWFILIALRRPFNPIVRLSSPYVFPSPSYRYNLAGWAKWTNYVWTKSIFNGASVSTTIWQNLGVTLVMIALISVMSIMIAGMLLFVGVFINRVIKSSTWWAKARGILRLVLVSAGAGIPVFVISAFIAVFILKHESIPQHQIPFFWSAFFCSLMPSWLLVQAGYGILSNRAEKTISLHLVQQISIRLSIRVLHAVDRIRDKYGFTAIQTGRTPTEIASVTLGACTFNHDRTPIMNITVAQLLSYTYFNFNSDIDLAK